MSYKEFIPSCFNQISNWDDELPLFLSAEIFQYQNQQLTANSQ